MTSLNNSINIGKLKIKNRYVMPPMNTNFSDENGSITEQMTSYYVRRAQGGVGLIIVEAASVVSDIVNHGVQPLLHDEKYIPAWANMVERIKRYGAKVSVEIAHYGSEGTIGPKVSASDVSSISSDVRPLTIDEIDVIVDQFVSTVMNAKTAGFDAVTLHAAHGYFLAQFLSPLYNKRTDEYGGSLENRMRVLLRILEKCRAKAGRNYPIMVRYSVDEFIAGGRELEESIEIAKILEKAGVDAIDISAGVPSTYVFGIPPYSMPERYGFLVSQTKEIKKAVNIPVICVSGIRTPQHAKEIIENGAADMVALGRTLIADPDFCKKAFNGQDEDIRQCLSCQYCLDTLNSGRSLRCTVNPEAGREYEFDAIEKTDSKKKVAVVGAGPAGMEAARVAALRGHNVTLYDKADRLGGTLTAGAVPPNKEKLNQLILWYTKQLSDLRVKVNLNTEISSRIKNVDALILACGASYAKVVQGCDNKIVMSATEALNNPEKVGKRIVIIGGGVSGSETAEYFAGEQVKIDILRAKDLSGELEYKTQVNQGIPKKDITVIEMLGDICNDMDEFNRPIMKITLKENGVKIMTNTKAQCINEQSVSVIDMETDEVRELMADTVVLSSGLISNEIKSIDGSDCETYWIGDCKQPGKISDAIYSGYYTSRMI